MTYFTDKELACSCCGDAGMDPVFMSKVTKLREKRGKPLTVTSAYRCPKHNQEVSSTGPNGPHTTRRAIDIKCSYEEALELLELALGMRNEDGSRMFTGVGLNQKGSGRFLHLDDLPNAPGQPRPTCWTY